MSREKRGLSREKLHASGEKRDLPREILVVSIMRRPSYINCWYLPMFCVFLNCKSVVLYCDSCMISLLLLTSWTHWKRKSEISREKCNNRYIRSYIRLVFPPVQNSRYCYVIYFLLSTYQRAQLPVVVQIAGGIPPVMVLTGKLCPKGVPFQASGI